MLRQDIEPILKNLARKLIKNLPVKKVVAAICDKENIPMIILSPTPTKLPANVWEDLTNAFGKKLVPIFVKEGDNLVIKFVETSKVSKCEQVASQENPYPIEVLKDGESCMSLYKQIFIDKEDILVFFEKEGCQYCEELQQFIFGDGLGLTEEQRKEIDKAFDVPIVFVDESECPSLKKIFGVRVYPTLLFFSEGKLQAKVEGFSKSVEARKKAVVDLFRLIAFYSEKNERLKKE